MLQHRKTPPQKFLCIAAVEASEHGVQLDAVLIVKLKLTVVLLVMEVKTLDPLS